MSDDFADLEAELAGTDDDYVARQQAAARKRLIVVAVVVVLLGGGVMYTLGARKAEARRVLAEVETLALRGDYEDVSDAAGKARSVVSGAERAAPEILSAAVRSQLARYVLYTGDSKDEGDARRMLEAAQLQYPDDPQTHLAAAVWEGLRGDPAKVEPELALAGAASAPTWAAVARSDAALRRGDFTAASSALEGQSSQLAKTWALRMAWKAGDGARAVQLADELIAARADHSLAQLIRSLQAARQMDAVGAEAALRKLLTEGKGLAPLQGAAVEVELSRAIRRTGNHEGADEVLANALARDKESPILMGELARVKRFEGLFGAARTYADKAMRAAPSDPDLLAELAGAAYFNDMVALIKDRVGKMPAGSEESDGVRRARAMISLMQGSGSVAARGLGDTRHLGTPGDAELWLTEAWLRAGKPEQAITEAQAAVERFTATLGAESREAGTARMYLGLAQATAGLEEGAATLEDVYADRRFVTPWTAWLYGRFHELSDPEKSKDAYLLACHNGQDFALACWDLARIYDSLEMDSLMRRTQREARNAYLRTSPKGSRAPLVRAALDD